MLNRDLICFLRYHPSASSSITSWLKKDSPLTKKSNLSGITYVCLYLECLRKDMDNIYKSVTPKDAPHPSGFPGSKESELCSHVGIGCALLITKVKAWNNATYSNLLMEKKSSRRC